MESQAHPRTTLCSGKVTVIFLHVSIFSTIFGGEASCNIGVMTTVQGNLLGRGLYSTGCHNGSVHANLKYYRVLLEEEGFYDSYDPTPSD